MKRITLVLTCIFPITAQITHGAEPRFYVCESYTDFKNPSNPAICAKNFSRESAGSGTNNFIQSFIADCDYVDAVKLGVGGRDGWGSLELIEPGENGALGRILAQTLVKQDNNCGLSLYGPTTFKFDKTPVKRGGKYYLRYLHSPGEINYSFTTNNNYKGGELFGKSECDVNFIVFSESVPTPYLRQISVSTECKKALLPFTTAEMQLGREEESDGPLAACQGYEYLTPPDKRLKGSIEWILQRLFTEVGWERNSALDAIWELSPAEKEKLVSILYDYPDTDELGINERKRIALQRIGPDSTTHLPQILNRIEKGDSEAVSLVRYMGADAKQKAVPILMKVLKRDKAIVVARALEEIRAPESLDTLVNYNLENMRNELKKMYKPHININREEDLPQGCIIKDLLPNKAIAELRDLPGMENTFASGVSFMLRSSYSPKDPGINIYVSELGAMFGQKIETSANDTIYIEGCYIDYSVANEIRRRLGRDTTPAVTKDGCQPRRDYPKYIQNLIPIEPNRPDIQIRYNANMQTCGDNCKLFTKPDFEKLVGFRIPEYMETVKFSIEPCSYNKSRR